MASINVKSDFITKLQPFICGEEVFSKDAPYCETPPKEIDFDAYYRGKKLAGYIPDWFPGNWTPVAVQFCDEYNKLYVASNQLCIDTPEEVQRELAVLVGGGKTRDGKTAAEVTYSDIYSLVARQAPGVTSEQYRRMTKQFEAKAKAIYSGLKEIEELKAKSAQPEDDAEKLVQDELAKLKNVKSSAFAEKANSVSAAITNIAMSRAKEIPEIEEKKVALLNSIRQVCVDDNSDALKSLANECGKVQDEHKAIKGNLAWATGWISAGLGVVWALAKTGRLGKSIDAWKDEWKNQGEMGRGWYNPVRILESVWAFIRAKEGMHQERPEPIPENGEPTEIESAGQNESASAEGETKAPEGQSDEADAADAAGKTSSPYLIKIDYDLAELSRRTEEALQEILGAGRGLLGESHPSIMAIRDAVEVSEANGKDKLDRLLPILRSSATVDMIDAITATRRHHFFNTFLPYSIGEVPKIKSLIKQGKIVEGEDLLKNLIAEALKVYEASKELTIISNIVAEVERTVGMMFTAPDDGMTNRIEMLLEQLGNETHDVRNIVQNFIGINALHEMGDKSLATVFIESMKNADVQFNAGNVNSLLKSVAYLNSATARKHLVTVNADTLSTTHAIPEEIRIDLFRVLFEAVHNGIKYSDLKKADRRVNISVAVEDETMTFTVEDNGAGMSEEQARLIQEKPGMRFHKELASGTGNGVHGTILGLARKHGWEVTYITKPHEGTKIIIKVQNASASPSGKSSADGNDVATGKRRIGGIARSEAEAGKSAGSGKAAALLPTEGTETNLSNVTAGGNAAVQGAANLVGSGSTAVKK